MTAYWISVSREIVDEAKVAAYATLAGPALEAAGGTFVARGLPEQIYEPGENTRTPATRLPKRGRGVAPGGTAARRHPLAPRIHATHQPSIGGCS